MTTALSRASDLGSDVDVLLAELDEFDFEALPVAEHARFMESLRQWVSTLTDLRDRVEHRLGQRMGEKHVDNLERSYKSRKRTWDDEGLWRTVLDTRVVDEATGEIVPQHEVILRVYGSRSKATGEMRMPGRNASTQALEAVGIDAAAFYEDEDDDDRKWSVRVHR
jgi:hypothetical protein